jgi:hypothetical protein
MATSTVPTLKANLVTQLQARAGLSGIQVTNGPPLPAPSREYIWVGDTEGTQELAAFNAPNQRHEVYNVKVVIHVEKDGTDTAATDARCFVLSAELENQLRADPTVSGAVNVAQLTTFRLTEFVQPDGMARIAELVVDVNCQQWI